jgi:hypothetical protein
MGERGAWVVVDARNLTPNPFPRGKGDQILGEAGRGTGFLGEFRCRGQ